MGVSIKAKQWTVRAGDVHEEYGDEYTGGCIVDEVSPTHVRITLMVGEFPVKDLAILRRKLREMGYKIKYERTDEEGNLNERSTV